MEKKPRPHAEIIKAWADGEQIQYRAPGNDAWVDCPDPAWTFDYEYRAKPERVYPESKLEDGHICAMYGWFKAHPLLVMRARDNATVAIRHAIDNGQVVTREEFECVSQESKRAVRTLHLAGYTDHGGELWKPPIGNAYAKRIERDIAVAEAVRHACILMFRVTGWPDVEKMDLDPIIAGVVS